MRRNFSQLCHKVYDVAVIGGGIYGISVARDAALRGLTVVVVEQGDFGSATSSNHQRIIHGGLRYLQHIDLKRMRESIRERSILLRIAPHLVHPLPFLLPTYQHLMQGRLLLSLALKINDLISLDRNRNLEPHKKIPRGRLVSKSECLQLWPNINQRELTGGALFFDAQVHNADRLNLSLLFSAAEAGAEFANYVQMTGFLENGATVAGIQVKDVLSGDEFAIRARVVVNCAGPWLGRVLQLLGTSRSNRPTKLLKAVVLVTRPLVQNVAVGIPSRSAYADGDAVIQKGYRYFFIAPWRHTSLIGTFQTPYERDPDELEVTEEEILDFVRQINAIFPGALIKRQDVYRVLSGLLPSADLGGQNGDAGLQKRYEIRDHGVEDGIQGLVSVAGVKYTTARGVAEKTVDLVLKKLRRELVVCRTTETPVHGGRMDCFEEFSDRALKERSKGVSAETLKHLLETYGSEYRRILRYCDANATWSQLVSNESPTIKAEVLHGVRVEMAQKLSDIIFRRTELGTAGYPGDACFYTCAEIMAAELGWNKKTMFRELDEVQQEFRGD